MTRKKNKTQKNVHKTQKHLHKKKKQNIFRTNIFLASLLDSYSLFAKKSYRLLPTLILDIAFLLGSGSIITHYMLKIYDSLVELSAILSTKTQEITQAHLADPSIAKLIFNKEIFESHMSNLMSSTLMIVLSSLIFWCVLQGLSWRLSAKMSGQKVDYFHYIGKFTLITVLWVFFFFSVFSIALKIMMQTAMSLTPSVSGVAISYSTLFINFALIYFMFIAYSLINKEKFLKILKKTFIIGIKRIYITAPMFLLILLKFYLASSIISELGKISTTLFFVPFFIIIFPLVVWARLFMIILIERIKV
ncbi:hypothetical protein ACFL0W_06160 [Nanoarchaeota archaeon]